MHMLSKMNVLVLVTLLLSFVIFCVLADQKLLFITQNSIKKYDITNNTITVPIDSDVTKLSHLNDVDYDFQLQIMFYLVDMKEIYSYNLITKQHKLVLKTNQEIPHIAVDWVTKKIYVSVSDRKRIIVCSYDGTRQKILFQRPLSSNLRAVCVSPRHGYLFFSDIGYNAKIERANMDGTNAVELVTKDITMPNALAIDPIEPILYWVDIFEQTVEMIHMDGKHRKILLDISKTNWGTISALAVLESSMFFMGNPIANAEKDLNSAIISCWKFNETLKNCTTNIEDKRHFASIKAYGQEYQPFIKSACAMKNGPCSHLCLLNPNGYSCACPTGFKVNEDNRTCSTSFKKFILFATKPDLRLISLDVTGRYDTTLPVKSQKSVSAVDYDPIDKMIYWTEVKHSEFGVIKRATLDGKVIEEVVSQGYTLPDHLVVDWVARNLYWTCPKFKKIYVSRLDGSSNMVVINDDLEQPRGIAVDPGDGRLYWSDWGTNKPKIESSDLDGSKRKVLVDYELQWPNGIALDYHNRHLYWVDAGTDKIEYYDLSKKTRNRLPKAGSPHAFGISILGEMVYWTDWQKRSLYQFNKETKKLSEIVDSVPDIMGIKAVDTTLHYGKNDCGNKNFGCSHFCFHKPNYGAYCACPAGYHLSEDSKNCKAVTGFLLFASKTSIQAVSLKKSPKSQSSGSKVLGKDISHIEAFAKTNRVYWVEDSPGHRAVAIKSVSLDKDKTEVKEYVQTGFSGLLGGIAIDWLAENIYWSQSKLQRIEVSRLDGRFKRILVNNTNASITHIAVNPMKRRLYWFEEHAEGPRLISSDLNGGRRNILANASRKVYGLTVDVNASRVYWMLDTTLHSLTWDGRDEKIVNIAPRFPVGMKFFRNNIYTCESENSHSVALTISAINVTNGRKSVLLFDPLEWCGDITAFYTPQLGDNICEEGNGGCEQLCFATTLVNRTCQCESHYTLNADNTSCSPPDSYLLIGQKEGIFRFEPSEQTNLALNLKTSTTIIMLAFNILTDTLFWLEAGLKNTIKYLYNNVVYTLDLHKIDADPQSFTIDFFSNVLYWTDRVDHTISFVHLSNTSTTKYGVIFNHKGYRPTKITAVPEKGILIFVNDMHFSPTIESVTMDGHTLKTLHTFTGTDTRCDITVDYKNSRVYWLHSDKKIESVSLQGGEIQELMEFDKENFKPLTIAVYGNRIYWIDKKQKDSQVEYLKWRYIQKELNGIYAIKWEYDGSRDLHVVQTDRLNAPHPCKTNNGGCSHICFYTGQDSIDTPQCGCPVGYGFLDDKRTQCEKKNNGSCVNICNGRCLSSESWCDVLVNCQQEELKDFVCSCKKNKYMCLDDFCIISSVRFCDGHQDCSNNIDEDEKLCSVQTTTPRADSSSTHLPPEISSSKNDSPFTAGIVSGIILTMLVLSCVFYVLFKFHHKKAALQKEEANSFLQHTKFRAATESAFVMTPSRAESTLSGGTFMSNNLTPRENNFPIRYITGSSTNMTDSTILPFNPPPTIASGSMTSVNEYPNDDVISEMSVELPAPPATPLYDPSDVESVLTNDIDNTHGRSCNSTADRKHILTCRHCMRQQNQQNYLYKHFLRRGSQSSDSYTQVVAKKRPLYSKSSCFDSESTCSSNKSFRSNLSSYHPPSLVSATSTTYRNNTLPRMQHNGGARRLVPSLASDMSRCSSETSVVTVRQRDNLTKYSDDNDGNYYNNYAPPPSPGLEYTPELNDFKDFKDEEEEALENDVLIESHRPQSSSEIF